MKMLVPKDRLEQGSNISPCLHNPLTLPLFDEVRFEKNDPPMKFDSKVRDCQNRYHLVNHIIDAFRSLLCFVFRISLVDYHPLIHGGSFSPMSIRGILAVEVVLLWSCFSPLLPLLTAPRREEGESAVSPVPRLACTMAAAAAATTAATTVLLTASASKEPESITGGLARGSAGFLLGTCVIHAVAVVLGAPLIRQVPETLLFSALVSAMTFLPVSVTSRQPWQAFVGFLRGSRPAAYEPGAMVPAVGCAVGAWLGAIPLSLDWERPWQDWPLPMCVGGLLGFSVGALLLSGIHLAEKVRRKFSAAARSSKRV